MIFFVIKNNNFDNCCVFQTVQNTSNILVTYYLKNNHFECHRFHEDCLSFLHNMHVSRPISYCSGIANAGGWRGEDL